MPHCIKKFQILLLLIFIFILNTAMAQPNSNRFNRLYGQFLKDYWHPPVMIHHIKTTVFNYDKMKYDSKQRKSLLDKIKKVLASTEPSRIVNPNTAKAFWINVYNFAAMSLILKHYPVQSIRDLKISWIKHPWSKKVINVGGTWYSLSYIEKDILLKKYKDPRIIFAVSCAAISCPDQLPESFTATHVNQQLNDQIKQFLNNPTKGLRFDGQNNVLYLSWIFKKDRLLFGETDRELFRFIRPYLNESDQQWLQKIKHIKIAYLYHDWTLNDLRLSKDKD